VPEAPVLTAEQVQQLLADYLGSQTGIVVERVDERGSVFLAPATSLPARPGGAVSGPALFRAVDVAGFLAVQAIIGANSSTVLTSSTINFLDSVQPRELRITVSPTKVGRRRATLRAQVHAGELLLVVATLSFAYAGRAPAGQPNSPHSIIE
jgi:acyl-coenzyme A thioesterase PaaI-like protein